MGATQRKWLFRMVPRSESAAYRYGAKINRGFCFCLSRVYFSDFSPYTDDPMLIFALSRYGELHGPGSVTPRIACRRIARRTARIDQSSEPSEARIGQSSEPSDRDGDAPNIPPRCSTWLPGKK